MKSFIFVALFIFTNVNAADKLNPDLSINFLGLYRYSALGNDSSYSQPNGFFMQEAEILSSANIDAYFRGNVAFALRKESTGYKIEPEEAYIETLSVPGVTFKAGKFFALVGKHNNLHTHAFPFIDAPLANTLMYGDEGINENGFLLRF